jgi:hypothetical protein
MSKKDPTWWGARRTKYGDMVSLPAVWGEVKGPIRVSGKLEWLILQDGGTRLMRIRVGPGEKDFEIIGI